MGFTKFRIGTVCLHSFTGPVVPTNLKALAAFAVECQHEFSGRGMAFAFGPSVFKRNLVISHETVKNWIQKNKTALMMDYMKEKKIKYNMLFVVLEEWMSPTWVRMIWEDSKLHPGPTFFGLTKESVDEPLAWKFMTMNDRVTSLSSFMGNGVVLSFFYILIVQSDKPMVVAIDGIPIVDNLNDKTWMRMLPLMKDFGIVRSSKRNHLRKIARLKNRWIFVESVAQGVCDLPKIESAVDINSNMVWIGSQDVLNPKHAIKRRGNIVFSFATGMTATSPLNG